MKIMLLWATIRVDFMKETYNYWIQKAKNPENIDIKIAVNTEEQKNQLLEFKNVLVTNQKHIGTVYPIYLLTKNLELENNDIIIVASDDFYPPENWDEHLINKLNGKSGCYFVNDGYQSVGDLSIKASITMPVMTFDCLCKLNKMLYSLDYHHYYADTELYNNLVDLNLLIDDRINDSLVFEHKNCVSGKRVTDEYDLSYHNHVHIDKDSFNRRQIMDVKDRIKKTRGVW